MADLIQATVVGRLTRDADLRQAGSSQVCSFTVAAKPFKADESLFFNASVWGRRGEAIAEYLTKGQQVVVVGDLSERSYETKSGETRVSKEINATAVSLVGSRDGGGRAATQDDSDSGSGDLPF